MARERFITVNFRPERMAMVQRANTIVQEYVGQGLRLTLRQLHYQFVTRFPDVGGGKAPDGGVPYLNSQKSYKNLGSMLSDARLGGLIDWNAIEDRGRRPERHAEWDSLEDLVDAALSSFRLPRWEGQSHYVEL